jgi:hypothetical protein
MLVAWQLLAPPMPCFGAVPMLLLHPGRDGAGA